VSNAWAHGFKSRAMTISASMGRKLPATTMAAAMPASVSKSPPRTSARVRPERTASAPISHGQSR
jgi:Rieske Fe-S protein